MGDEPFCEVFELRTGLEGDVEIPTLGTRTRRRMYCVYSQTSGQSGSRRARMRGGRVATSQGDGACPAAGTMTDANLLVDGQRLTAFATHVIDLPETRRGSAKDQFLHSARGRRAHLVANRGAAHSTATDVSGAFTHRSTLRCGHGVMVATPMCGRPAEE